MKKLLVAGLILWWMSEANGVIFRKYIIDQGLNRSHGVWSGDVQGNNPRWVFDAFGTIGLDFQAVWYENRGFGTVWGPKQVIYTSDRVSYEICAGDLDGNGTIDAVSNHFSQRRDSGWLAIHKNTGDGSFTTTELPRLHSRIRELKLADVDADGDNDIIVGCNTYHPSYQTQTGVYWYRNDGGMSFTQHFLGKYNARKCDYADFNGDNHLEFVFTEEAFGADTASPCRLILFKNNGAEVFTADIIDNVVPPSLWNAAGGVCAADFDGDGDIDIVTGMRTASGGEIYLYRNNGGWPNPTFSKITIDVNAPAYGSVDKCDFDIDGDMDFVACGRNYWMAWYKNDGSGNFTKHIIETGYELPVLPHVTYLDGDSCCDIIMSVDGFSNNGLFIAYLNPCPAVDENEYAYGSIWLKVPTIIGNNYAEIEYSVKDKEDIRLDILDLAGRVVKVLDERDCSQPGIYRKVWDIDKEPNGIYLVRLVTKNTIPITKKTILLR